MSAEQRYRILRRIAAGGMVEVFPGEAQFIRGFRKRVAIKRILPQLTRNPRFVSMFLDEARLSLGFAPVNIASVFDIGHAGGVYFIVMEHVDGLSLGALLESLHARGQQIDLGSPCS